MNKIIIIVAFTTLLIGCIGSSTAFTNRSVTYQFTPSIEGTSNSLTEKPQTADTTVNAEKSSDAKANVTTGTSTLNDNENDKEDVVNK